VGCWTAISWQVDAIVLGEDHFMLLSMFNLYS
jgi:hypothetical protein